MSDATKKPWTVTLDHAAVATREPQKLKQLLLWLGLEDCGDELVASQGIRTHFIKPSKSEPSVEILEVVDNKSTVAKFLEKKGPGIHHLSFLVTNLDALSADLRARGVRLVYAEPQPGAHKTRVNFIHPESTGGVLIEISEKASK
ncbi:MAG: VOC family protein [Bdellovibrionota bacterium]